MFREEGSGRSRRAASWSDISPSSDSPARMGWVERIRVRSSDMDSIADWVDLGERDGWIEGKISRHASKRRWIVVRLVDSALNLSAIDRYLGTRSCTYRNA